MRRPRTNPHVSNVSATVAQSRAVARLGVKSRVDRGVKLRQKDRNARWTVKYSKAKPTEDGAKRVDLAIPAFGYKNHVGIDRAHGLIRTWTATDASRHDGAQLPNLVDKNNTASDVWADTA
jgi:transposase, IS5 family